MCGIVAASAHRDVSEILISGLHALEYRGYDSAGIALQQDGAISRLRTRGKVRDLESLLEADALHGNYGIAHTRWATHGEPNTVNAHPHLSEGVKVPLSHVLKDFRFILLGQCGHYPWFERNARDKFYCILKSEIC